MNALEAAAARSAWARRNVGEKILLLGGLLILAVALPPIPFAPVIAVIAWSIAYIARVPRKLYVAMVLAPAAFVLVGAFPLLVALTPDGLAWSPDGPQRMAQVVMRSFAGISCTMVFALTTPISELIAWLDKHGLSRYLTYLAEVIYRMTGVLIHSAHSMTEAQARRLGHSTRRAMIRDVAAQSASLFVIAFTRARKMQEGIELRADPSAMKVLVISRPRQPKFIAISSALLLSLIAAWALLKWGV
ncbi:cobalt ECF transporter T component CbiQ [Corynebacterium sp. LK29]|uniref:CbiQ family ECF transporter T component n=1 Tax=Corynebacterium sp. LK29 TaxID=2044578 RepID=UPI0016521C2B|nr:cobalt ECF transporter T component CbiQ [Corynebacterium sp. LK29]